MIVLPNNGMYPIHPKELGSDTIRTITSYSELDDYLAHLLNICSSTERFVVTNSEIEQYFSNESNVGFYSSHNRQARSERLQKDGYLYIAGDSIFLTHKLITKAAISSKNIALEHIEFDDISRKTTMERLHPEVFSDIKSMMLKAKKENCLGPFSPEEFPHAGDLNHFVNTDEKGFWIKSTLLMNLFTNYPSMDYVSVEISAEQQVNS